MMSRFDFLNAFIENIPRFSEKVAAKAEKLYSEAKIVESPFGNSFRVQGNNYFYTVDTNGTKSVKCDCPARRRCYHMAIVDKHLKEKTT